MKSLPLLLLAIILLASACKKPKVEQSEWRTKLNGKTYRTSLIKHRIRDSSSTIFEGFSGSSDSMTTGLYPFFNANTEAIEELRVTLSLVINFTSANSFILGNGNRTFAYTGDYDKYWVFSRFVYSDITGTDEIYDAELSASRFTNTPSLPKINNYIDSIDHESIFSWIKIGNEYFQHYEQLFIPKDLGGTVNMFLYGIFKTSYGRNYYLENVTKADNWSSMLNLDTAKTNSYPYGADHYKKYFRELVKQNSSQAQIQTATIQ